MKTREKISGGTGPGLEFHRRRERRSGYTIAEVMMAMAVALMVIAAVVACHLMGLRMFELTKSRLGASDDARRAVGALMSEVRSAKIVRIGRGSEGAFAAVDPDQPQIGSAIQIYPTTNTGVWIRYYWDSDRKVKRVRSDHAAVMVVASGVSNQLVFSAEDFRGRVLTNNLKDFVVGLNLQFHQLQYPTVEIGPGQLFDRYQMQTRIALRAP